MDLHCPDGVPSNLVRVFTSADDLENWRRGRLRLRSVSYYRELECDVRGDRGDGEARHVVKGANGPPVQYGCSSDNATYLLSFSEREAPAVPERRYGSFVVEIPDIRALMEEIRRCVTLLSLGERELLSVSLLRVRYNRGAVIDPEPNESERWRLVACQKLPEDAIDREWLIVVSLSGAVAEAPTELWLNADGVGRSDVAAS